MEEDPQSYPVRLDYARFIARDNPVEALQLLHQLICERPAEVSGWAMGGQIALGRPEFLEFARDWTGEALKVLPRNDVLTAQRLQALLLNGNVVEALTVARGTPVSANPALTALQILCEFVTGHLNKVEVANEPQVSQEFVTFYRLLLTRECTALVHLINDGVQKLKGTLPTAANVLEQALQQAALAA